MKKLFTKVLTVSLVLTLMTSSALTFADTTDIETKDTNILTKVESSAEKITNVINSLTEEMNESFNDLTTHWSYKYVRSLIDKNVINGYADGTFKPDNGITVAEFTKLLMVNNQIELGAKGSNWYNQYISGARELGIIQGGEITDYNKMITRAEMARMISRSLNLTEWESTAFEDGGTFRLYRTDIYKVSNAGIVTGYDDNTFRPFKGATRGEASTMISRVNDYLGDKVIAPLVTDIPDYNADGSWTDEWFLEKIKDVNTMYKVTNCSENSGDYYFEDGKLKVHSEFFVEPKIITVEDEVQNKRLLKLIKYYVQRAYETNRYARVEHWQPTNEDELTDLIRIDFSPRHMGADSAYLAIDLPLHPKEYMSARFRSNIDTWNVQDAGAIWIIGKMFDERGFPSDFNYLDGVKRGEVLEDNQYIMEPYREIMFGTGEILYGSKEKSEPILNYMIQERLKQFATRGYENYTQLEISGFKIHNDNWSRGKPYFITEIE
ncbi:MAG: S-layer homology domain-containing protein [Acidaminobacteraceae bacterium]